MKKLFIIVAFLIAAASWWLSQQINKVKFEPLNISEPLVEIKAGQTFNQLCHLWQRSGALSNCFPYQLYSKLEPKLFALQAGFYDLKGLTVLDAISKISRGEQHNFSFTIIEGMPIWEVKDKLLSAPYLTQDIDKLTAQLNISQSSAEGWLYPDTYHYHGNDSAQRLLKRAHTKMQSVLEEEWQNRMPDLPLNTPYEALILASIIEKETGVVAERDKVASVFINRLRKGMRLQTDPTIIYGIGEQFDGDIKREDIREKTPYNTYRIDGLPPTPIAMPSRAAIHAALNPATTEYLYFVASGDGGHHFSKTLTEHNKAVKKFILKQ
ncbi:MULTISPECIES: endolytic transglycosylase MltG [unclassified Pseudoalteromonas]|uniref:endolytic transglycosylase MltG n=1 Tax=unclassified Pseudoalteromonas TaxID=194690 RepID=UPI000C7BA0A8|nr:MULTISPECIES: endolytic transglycosylase MltG [unclassified Pseudoalteromonas]AUJ70275.1 putative aminodeoxychorismate lyase [Pseudoalteromonas sp. NC201]MCF2827010.1 endolytic transglycosylase MltG [Pseudoalteromonas sp. OF5H-5]MCF2834462.1 endolytic transglycosylase MltG [Pseudoalteromonas sp. DL2-H6]MCF2923862.1 endolytic transglycosylase MltG [Pseudoalteromonas sp. DL2-H1]MCF7514011.1 endolytic transglycosylase MltG [Pseudoalteromonas sp. L7]